MLSKDVGYSTSQVSTLLSGRIPPRDFVIRLVEVTVPPMLRERRQAEALRLLQDAEHPPGPAPKPAPAPAQDSALALAQTQAEQIQVYERLTRALEQEGELRQAAENSARLVWVLLGVVNTLEERVHKLSGERDGLAAQVAGGELEEAQKRIERAEEQRATAESELARAQDKRRQAEDLADRLRREIEALTDDLDRLRGDGPSPHDHLPTLAGASQDVGASVMPRPTTSTPRSPARRRSTTRTRTPSTASAPRSPAARPPQAKRCLLFRSPPPPARARRTSPPPSSKKRPPPP
ncbi:hypothetical protein AB0A05_35150 [Streptomyces sp. NPDC046374]|uniref:hypothetical protein n=1 Tax=Streptomyces sp. NPDC046374 TaxID=3154917 RepID=UPI003400C126